MRHAGRFNAITARQTYLNREPRIFSVEPSGCCGPGKQEANGMSDGDVTLIAASRVSDRA